MTSVNTAPPGAPVAHSGATRLVGMNDPQRPFSSNQECDARLAITRGLAEYVASLQGIAMKGGRMVRFKDVFEESAEPEEQARYPSVAITLQGSGTYEARSFTPTLEIGERLPNTTDYLVVMSDFTQNVLVDCWSTDPLERSAVVMMLERAFNPWPDRYGFTLELPHYFNARGTYELKELTVSDVVEDNARRMRNAQLLLAVRIPIISIFSFPDAKPRFDLQGAGDGADVLVTIEVS